MRLIEHVAYKNWEMYQRICRKNWIKHRFIDGDGGMILKWNLGKHSDREIWTHLANNGVTTTHPVPLLHFLIVSNNCGCSYVEIFYSRLLFLFLRSIYFPLLFLHLCSFLRLRWPDPFSCRSHSLSVTLLLAFSICCILLQILIWDKEKYSINGEILIWKFIHYKLSEYLFRGGDKSLARQRRKQTTATEDFDVNMSYL